MENNKRFMSTFIIFSVGYIVLGLLLLLAPETSQRIITYIIGGVAVVSGLARIVLYLMKNNIDRPFQNELAVGVVLLIAGVYLIARPDNIWQWIPVLIGFGIVFDSIIKMQQAFDLKRGGFSFWWLMLIVSMGTTVLGALLILNVFTSALFIYLGIVLIADGIINIVSILLLYVYWKKSQKGQGKPAAAHAPEPPIIEPAAPLMPADDNQPPQPLS